MSEWNLYGTSRKETFEDMLDPHSLSREFTRYREELGDCFSIENLLQIMEIRAIALIAEGINDAPEFMADQIGKMRNGQNSRTIVDSLDSISEAITDFTEKH